MSEEKQKPHMEFRQVGAQDFLSKERDLNVWFRGAVRAALTNTENAIPDMTEEKARELFTGPINALKDFYRATMVEEATASRLREESAVDSVELKLDGVAEHATANIGTITSVKMNGSTVSSSGEADLGTVITAHQDISGKADKSATVSTVTYDSTNKKITKTINSTTTDVVTVASIQSALGSFTWGALAGQ